MTALPPTGQLLGLALITAVIAVLYVLNCWLSHRARGDDTAPFEPISHVKVTGGQR